MSTPASIQILAALLPLLEFLSPVSVLAASFSPAISKGLVKHSKIPEGSGLAASRKHPDILYTHNDHGGKNRIFALDANTAEIRATLTISKADNKDWEDIAVGTCGSGTCIYIGDIGDSNPKKKSIYKVREPETIKDQSLDLDGELKYTWEDNDCETLMIDPNEELYIATKIDGEAAMFAHIPTAGNWDSDHTVEIHSSAKFPFFTSEKNPVGGDISPDGREMLIKFKEWVLYYEIRDGESYADAIKRDPVKLPYEKEPRGESVCWSYSADGYFTMSESEGEDQPLYFYQRSGGGSIPSVTPSGSHTGSSGTQFSSAQNKGLVKHSEIPEGSGLAASRKHPGILYTHNDHGGSNRLFAIDTNTAELRATFSISGATNNDWEDVAVGSCGQDTCIYIGDIGDGGPSPKTIYRVREPGSISDQSLSVDSKLLYSWSEPDAETLMIDPSEELYIASKIDDQSSWFAHVPTAGNWGTGHAVTVHSSSKFPFFTSKKNPVGGDISPNGKEMLIKFKEWVLYYKIGDGETYADAIKRDPIKLPYTMEPRGESVCWSYNAEGYYTMSEGEGADQPLYYYTRL